MSYVLVYINDIPLLAVFIHIITSTLYVVYITKTKPFIQKENTTFEIIYEYFVCINAICIMLFTNDLYSPVQKINIGWLYLAFNTIILSIIFKTLLQDLILKTIPEYLSKLKEFK